MQSVAKATIIIPLVLVMIAGVMRLSNASSLSGQNRSGNIRLSPAVTRIPTARPTMPPGNTQAFNLDLTGPYACSHTDIERDIKLFIQDRNVYARFTQQETASYFLLKDDCVYKWEGKQKTGMKVCNVGQYVSLLESLSLLPFFSSEMLFSFIPTMQSMPDTDISSGEISQLLNSCTSTRVDETLFEIPATVEFIEEELSNLSEAFLN